MASNNKLVAVRFPGRYVGSVRIGGAGLGNLLFPWARAAVFAKEHELKLIKPVWAQIMPRCILRFEKDFRYYGHLFRRTGEPLPKRSRIYEEHSQEEFLAAENPSVIVFSGQSNTTENFLPLKGHHAYLWEQLSLISKEDLNDLRQYAPDQIAIHVRLGDQVKLGWNTPLVWYCDVVKRVLQYAPSTEFLVYSDGSDEELEQLLQMNHVTRAPKATSALCDIARMAGAKGLILGRSSTFSRWAAFFGSIPVICDNYSEKWKEEWSLISPYSVCLRHDEDCTIPDTEIKAFLKEY